MQGNLSQFYDSCLGNIYQKDGLQGCIQVSAASATLIFNNNGWDSGYPLFLSLSRRRVDVLKKYHTRSSLPHCISILNSDNSLKVWFIELIWSSVCGGVSSSLIIISQKCKCVIKVEQTVQFQLNRMNLSCSFNYGESAQLIPPWWHKACTLSRKSESAFPSNYTVHKFATTPSDSQPHLPDINSISKQRWNEITPADGKQQLQIKIAIVYWTDGVSRDNQPSSPLYIVIITVRVGESEAWPLQTC
jgi:hypothetical protein